LSGIKLKNLVIAVLLLLNLFLLGILLLGRAQSMTARKNALDDLQQIMRAGGVSINTEGVSGDMRLPAVITARDTDFEQSIALAALGETTYENQGGGIIRYENAIGSASFNGRGEFVIEFTATLKLGGSEGAAARKMMKRMRISYIYDGETDDGGVVTASAHCAYRGTPIYNCRIDFEFSGGALKRITGRRAWAGNVGADALDMPTALMSFYSAVRAGEIECREIRGARSGYRMTTGAFGEGELTPAWLITTESGAYYVDAQTIERVTGE
jgi:hypothetical protein